VNQSAKFQKRIGERVRELRTARGISQEAFAAQCALHRTHMSLVERGHLNMTIGTLKAIIDALGIKASEFFRGME
jgi:transcriptional regulator with XRE-family HTH domain